jgi:hypothetical protein
VLFTDHSRRIEVDYQSGTELPHSKCSADLFTGFNYLIALLPVASRMKTSFCF